MSLVLGLDIGANSLGWSLCDSDILNYIDSGVRIFSDIDSSGAESNANANVERREYRQRRKLLYRKAYRKKLLFKYLKELGFINFSDFNDFLLAIQNMNPYILRAEALQRQLTTVELSRIFYHFIKRRGFLSNRKQLARTKEEERSVVKEGISATRNAMGENTLGAYLASIYPPDNEPFTESERIRKRFTSREMYIDEFNKIWEFQSQFYPDLLTEENKKLIGDPKKGIIFYQQPLKSQKHLRGKCTYETGKPRCNISRYEYEEYTFYQFVNNIELIDGYGEIRKLRTDEKATILELELALALNSKSRLTIKKIKNALKLNAFLCNYEDDVDLPTLLFMRFVNQFFPPHYRKEYIDPDFDKKIDTLWQILNYGDDDEWVIDKMKEKRYFPEDPKYNFYYDDNRIELLKKYYHREGYGSLSLKAIKNILPFLKKGYMYHIAVLLGGIRNAFGDDYKNLTQDDINKIEKFVNDVASQHHKEKELTEIISNWLIENYHIQPQQLAKLYHHTLENKELDIVERLPQFTENIRNPKVERALHEVRRLINSLIDKYGKPDKIVIEIANEIYLTKKQIINSIKHYSGGKLSKEMEEYPTWKLSAILKKKIQEYQLQNKKVNNEARNYLSNFAGVANPTREMLQKYQLFVEMLDKSDKNSNSMKVTVCPYTGKKITLENLFADGIVDIEHIIPYSRSLNDSLANKTLCYADFNRNLKKNSTSYEYFTKYEPNKWKEVKQRAEKLLPKDKYKRFISENVPDADTFASNKLNDTRYISRIVADYVKQLHCEVQVVAGTITATVRKFWGLNTILNELNKNLYSDEEESKISDEKNREDHRHHAVDAMVLCLITKSIIQRLSTLKSDDDIGTGSKKLEYPWPNFKNDVRKQVENILISLKQKDKIAVWKHQKIFDKGKVHRVTTFTPKGKLHDETFYGYHQHPKTKKKGFVHRIPIENINKMSQVEKIMDKSIRDKIIKYLSSNNLCKNGKEIEKGAFLDKTGDGELRYKVYLKNHRGQYVPIKKVRIFEESENNRAILKEKNKWVSPGSNHHAEIYKYQEGKYYQKLVSFWEAVDRVKNKQPVYGNLQNPDKYICSIKKNDIFLLNYPEDLDYSNKKLLSKYLYRVQKISFNGKLEAPYYTFRALNASTLKYEKQELRTQSMQAFISLNPKRVFINHLGEIEKIIPIEF
ncbi:MAG TPA: HNH endonuclease domain-containing protein [Candidatus Kapabacteria bacterium]|nr:HNH endonuclease domain-containing protein [Candidatus Kapabacteria bacterium]